MNKIFLFSFILIQSLFISSMEKPSVSKMRVDVLPKDIQVLLLNFMGGNTVEEAITGFQKFYAASTQSQANVDIMKAIISNLVQRFEIDTSAELQKVVDQLRKRLGDFPVFKNKEFTGWIDQEKKRLVNENALVQAASESNLKKIKELLKSGTSVNTSLSYATPLTAAINRNNFDIVKYLIEQDAEVNRVSSYGQTPLMDAVRNASPQIVQLMIEKGAHVNVQNNEGETPLMASFGSMDTGEREKNIVKMLLDANANPNVVNKYGKTALSELFARYKAGNPIWDEVLSLLLKKGVNLNIGTISYFDGAQLLQMPILKYVRQVLRNNNLAELLIKHGATNKN